MASYTFLYLAADKEQRLHIGLTKDLSLERLIIGGRAPSEPFEPPKEARRVVHVERFTTMLDATERARKISRMSHARRQHIVTRANPNWLEVDEFQLPWVAAPGDVIFPSKERFRQSVSEPARRGIVGLEGSDSNDPELPGGVTANIPRGPANPPRTDAFRQPLPPTENQS